MPIQAGDGASTGKECLLQREKGSVGCRAELTLALPRGAQAGHRKGKPEELWVH